MTTSTVRWERKPSYSLAAAATCRNLADVVRPVSSWGSAMQVQQEHQAELAAIGAQAWAGHDRRLVARS